MPRFCLDPLFSLRLEVQQQMMDFVSVEAKLGQSDVYPTSVEACSPLARLPIR